MHRIMSTLLLCVPHLPGSAPALHTEYQPVPYSATHGSGGHGSPHPYGWQLQYCPVCNRRSFLHRRHSLSACRFLLLRHRRLWWWCPAWTDRSQSWHHRNIPCHPLHMMLGQFFIKLGIHQFQILFIWKSLCWTLFPGMTEWSPECDRGQACCKW